MEPVVVGQDADFGVVIGRFQIDRLHSAHIDLIQSVQDRHPSVIILLGVSSVPVTKNDPLPFMVRMEMLHKEFPNVKILPVHDHKYDSVWSTHVDKTIRDIIGPNHTATIYGGTDSFVNHYFGKFPTISMDSKVYVATRATGDRKLIGVVGSRSMDPDEAFRAGIIYATQNQYAACIPTVDVVIRNEKNEILLVKKPHEDKWRFCGGFADVGSATYEEDARREVHEELGIEISDPKFMFSVLINDWRYRVNPNKIKSLVFVATYVHGRINPQDDIEQAQWFAISELSLRKLELIEPEHVQIYDNFLTFIK